MATTRLSSELPFRIRSRVFLKACGEMNISVTSSEGAAVLAPEHPAHAFSTAVPLSSDNLLLYGRAAHVSAGMAALRKSASTADRVRSRGSRSRFSFSVLGSESRFASAAAQSAYFSRRESGASSRGDVLEERSVAAKMSWAILSHLQAVDGSMAAEPEAPPCTLGAERAGKPLIPRRNFRLRKHRVAIAPPPAALCIACLAAAPPRQRGSTPRLHQTDGCTCLTERRASANNNISYCHFTFVLGLLPREAEDQVDQGPHAVAGAAAAGLVEGGAGDVPVDPLGRLDELLQKQRGVDRGGLGGRVGVGQVGDLRLDARRVLLRERQPPGELTGLVQPEKGLERALTGCDCWDRPQHVAHTLVVGKVTAVLVPCVGMKAPIPPPTQCDDATAGQGGSVNDVVHLELLGVDQGVGQSKPALGVGVVHLAQCYTPQHVAHLDGLAVGGRDHVAGPVGVRPGHVLAGGADEVDLHAARLERGNGLGGAENGRHAAHVELHQLDLAGGALDVQAAGVEHDALADEGDLGLDVPLADVGGVQELRGVAATLPDGQVGAHAQRAAVGLGQDLDRQPQGRVLLLHVVGHGHRVGVVGRRRDELTRRVHRHGERPAAPGHVGAVEDGAGGDVEGLQLVARVLVLPEALVHADFVEHAGDHRLHEVRCEVPEHQENVLAPVVGGDLGQGLRERVGVGAGDGLDGERAVGLGGEELDDLAANTCDAAQRDLPQLAREVGGRGHGAHAGLAGEEFRREALEPGQVEVRRLGGGRRLGREGQVEDDDVAIEPGEIGLRGRGRGREDVDAHAGRGSLGYREPVHHWDLSDQLSEHFGGSLRCALLGRPANGKEGKKHCYKNTDNAAVHFGHGPR
ncbi:uncharacterized protein BcabD6B2_37310 [Babesia caballi]|uniref:Uncharacterized protein n=1 Tax=Babesia caballi TaxID=5871 RepID=A0AAV4LWS3_BABCB|nr:hypothetical protein BcabD6B2_37310 [Babesia caballi]